MRERRYGDIRIRTPSPPQRLLPRGGAHSPLPPRRNGDVSPLSHGRRHGVEEPSTSNIHSRYLSGKSRAEREFSPPIRSRREYARSPPLPRPHRFEPSPPPHRFEPSPSRHRFEPSPPPHRFEPSPPRYHLEAKVPVHSQPLTDAHYASSSRGLSFDRRRDGLGGEGYERGRYEADRYQVGYRDHNLQNKLGMDDRSSYGDSLSTKFQWKHLLDEKQPAGDTNLTHRANMGERFSRGEVPETQLDLKPTPTRDNRSAGNWNFPGYLGPSEVASDKYGFRNGDSIVGFGLGGDGTCNYDKLSARELSAQRPKFSYSHDLPNASSTEKIHAPSYPYVSKDRFPGYFEGISHNEYGQMPPDRSGYNSLPNAASTEKIHPPTYPYVSKDRFPDYLEGIGHDEYGQMPPARSGYRELLDTSPVIKSPAGNVGHEFSYTGERRNEGSELASLPDKLYYENLENVREKYGFQGTSRTSPEVHLADQDEGVEDYGEKYSRRSRFLDSVSGVPYMEGQDEGYVTGTTPLTHREEYLDFEPSHMVENDGFREVDGSWPYGDGFNSTSLSERDERLHDADWSSPHRLTEEELGSLDPYEKTVEPKRGFDKRRLGYNFAASDLGYEDERCNKEDANRLYGHLRHGRSARVYDSPPNKRRAIPEDYLFSDDTSKMKPVASAGRDIKKRLGPSQRNSRMPYPWVKRPILSQAKLNGRVSHGSQGGEYLETMADAFEINTSHNLDNAKPEPPEDSEEFTQLVNGAFLKFVKLLNESPAQRRKYTHQGQSGTLKCNICSRNSKEFVDTMSLAMHTFSTRATGYRVEHLGLHKALCVLMGWSSALGPNGTWVRQTLSEAEALALREDLIIWPPVVIIHNSSIANPAPNERLILSLEDMQDILRELGFGGDKTKVMRGRPANQSVMLASFNGTFSGLWEAESLHKHFVKKGHGRIEFDQISRNPKRIQGTGKAPEDKVSVLYGYLGVAEDLDRLDFEMKKRCRIRSRKEIQEIANVELKCG